jgi:AraC-like DNA-binding protein
MEICPSHPITRKVDNADIAPIGYPTRLYRHNQGRIAMIGAINGSLTGCVNSRQVCAAPLASLGHSVNPLRTALVRGLDSGGPVHPPLRVTGTLRTDEMHCELLKSERGEATEIEFSVGSHVIILLPDGVSGGCEWLDGEHAGRSSSMPPNTIFFSPAQNYLWLRKRASKASYRLLLLTIAPKATDRLSACNLDAASLRFVQRIGVDDESVRRTLLDFMQEIDNPGWNSKFYAETLLTLLLSQLVRCASNLTESQRMPYRKGGLASWRLKRALELLEGNLSEAPSLTELAHHLRLGPTSFCRAFKQSTGRSPHQYLLSCRISCAKEMMRDQARSLTEIALDCGFSSSSQFSVAFRRIVGTSPREYRRCL